MSSSSTVLGSSLDEQLASRSLSSVVGESFLCAFIVFVGTFGNIAGLLVLSKNHSLRNIPAYFVISLAISDIVMLDFCAPVSHRCADHGQMDVRRPSLSDARLLCYEGGVCLSGYSGVSSNKPVRKKIFYSSLLKKFQVCLTIKPGIPVRFRSALTY